MSVNKICHMVHMRLIRRFYWWRLKKNDKPNEMKKKKPHTHKVTEHLFAKNYENKQREYHHMWNGSTILSHSKPVIFHYIAVIRRFFFISCELFHAIRRHIFCAFHSHLVSYFSTNYSNNNNNKKRVTRHSTLFCSILLFP